MLFDGFEALISSENDLGVNVFSGETEAPARQTGQHTQCFDGFPKLLVIQETPRKNVGVRFEVLNIYPENCDIIVVL